MVKVKALTLLIAAAKVINPEGIKGNNLPSKIKNPVFLPFPSTMSFNNLFLSFIFSNPLLKPNLYIRKVMYPPITSPAKDIINPFIGPKKAIFAPVTKTDGTTPNKAIIILKISEIGIEYIVNS